MRCVIRIALITMRLATRHGHDHIYSQVFGPFSSHVVCSSSHSTFFWLLLTLTVSVWVFGFCNRGCTQTSLAPHTRIQTMTAWRLVLEATKIVTVAPVKHPEKWKNKVSIPALVPNPRTQIAFVCLCVCVCPSHAIHVLFGTAQLWCSPIHTPGTISCSLQTEWMAGGAAVLSACHRWRWRAAIKRWTVTLRNQLVWFNSEWRRHREHVFTHKSRAAYSPSGTAIGLRARRWTCLPQERYCLT